MTEAELDQMDQHVPGPRRYRVGGRFRVHNEYPPRRCYAGRTLPEVGYPRTKQQIKVAFGDRLSKLVRCTHCAAADRRAARRS